MTFDGSVCRLLLGLNMKNVLVGFCVFENKQAIRPKVGSEEREQVRLLRISTGHSLSKRRRKLIGIAKGLKKVMCVIDLWY